MKRDHPRLVRSMLPQVKFWILLLIPVVTITIAVFLTVIDNQKKDEIQVSLFDQSPVLSPREIGDGTSGQPDASLFRVAVSGVISPSYTLQYYQQLLTYMERSLERQVTLILKPTYAEINDLIQGGQVDVAFICSLAYVEGKEDFGMELLVAPQMNGQTVYYSYLIVPQNSSSASLEDLRGDSFAFTDPLSNSGHLAPTYQLALFGEDPVSFFSQNIYTYSHDNSILAVASELVDGAAVDSLVYEHLAISNPELVFKTKVIARWGPYGIPPVVVSPMSDSYLKQKLQNFFLDFHNSAEGDRILQSLGIDRFVIVPDSTYDSIREMKKLLGW